MRVTPTNSSQSDTLQVKSLHARGQNFVPFCAISLQKQAVYEDISQQLRPIILLILLFLFVAVCPCIPAGTVCGTEGRSFE